MGTRHADRIWMIGGAAVVALLVVAGWYLLIRPQYTATDDVHSQTRDTQVQLVTLRKRITELKKQQANLDTIEAALAKRQKALPADSGVPAFLRQLQAAGTATGVDVTGVAVSSPTQLANPPAVWSLPITLTAKGTAAALVSFLTTLQTGQARAVLIEKANLTPLTDTADSSTPTGSLSMSISLKAFVATTSGTAPTMPAK
jgi:type IV pilus assembly protein PilO